MFDSVFVSRASSAISGISLSTAYGPGSVSFVSSVISVPTWSVLGIPCAAPILLTFAATPPGVYDRLSLVTVISESPGPAGGSLSILFSAFG